MLPMTEVEKWARYALDCCNSPTLFPILEFEYRHNMTKRLGSALYSNNYGRPYGRIALSKEWFSILPEWEQIDTVIHEVLHIVTDQKLSIINYNSNIPYQEQIRLRTDNFKTDGHGLVWKEHMKLCGLPPKSCYTGDIKLDLTVPGYCACKEWKLTKQRAGRIRNRTNEYYCKLCKATIRLTPPNI